MESTEATRARAQAVLDYIVMHPEQHSQETWCTDFENPTSCGTTMCIAGTTLFLEDPRMLVSRHHRGNATYSEAASDLLGLNEEEGDAIFYDMNNQRALDKLIKVANGKEFDKDDFEYPDPHPEP